MLKFIGDFDKLKEYRNENLVFEEYDIAFVCVDNRGTCLEILKDTRKVEIFCGHRDFEGDYASEILYDLIKDNLVKKEKN